MKIHTWTKQPKLLKEPNSQWHRVWTDKFTTVCLVFVIQLFSRVFCGGKAFDGFFHNIVACGTFTWIKLSSTKQPRSIPENDAVWVKFHVTIGWIDCCDCASRGTLQFLLLTWTNVPLAPCGHPAVAAEVSLSSLHHLSRWWHPSRVAPGVLLCVMSRCLILHLYPVSHS